MHHGSKIEYPFYGKKTGMNEGKTLPIYLRVTINGERFEVSAQRYTEPAKWSSTAGKVKGNSEEARSINQHLDHLKQKVYDCQKKIIQELKKIIGDSQYSLYMGGSITESNEYN